MSTLIRLVIAILMALFTTSCVFQGGWHSGEKGNGIVVEDDREVTANFTEIRASEGINVFVTQNSQYSIVVEADENIIDFIGTEINDESLRIHALENIGSATKNVYVTLPNINSIKTSSGASLKTEGTLKTKDLSIRATSGSSITAKTKANNAEIKATSGAYLTVKGTCKYLNVGATSGANIKTNDLVSTTCDAKATSGAMVKVHVTQNLNARATSGANISYKGDPKVQKSKSVSGVVSRF